MQTPPLNECLSELGKIISSSVSESGCVRHFLKPSLENCVIGISRTCRFSFWTVCQSVAKSELGELAHTGFVNISGKS